MPPSSPVYCRRGRPSTRASLIKVRFRGTCIHDEISGGENNSPQITSCECLFYANYKVRKHPEVLAPVHFGVPPCGVDRPIRQSREGVPALQKVWSRGARAPVHAGQLRACHLAARDAREQARPRYVDGTQARPLCDATARAATPSRDPRETGRLVRVSSCLASSHPGAWRVPRLPC